MSQVADTAELENVLATFSTISESLVSGYETLAQRAEHVERELYRTNQQLEAKLAELDAVKRHLEAILQALPTGVVVRDETGRIQRVNDAALSILATNEGQLLGRECHEHLQGEAADGLSREIDRGNAPKLVVSSKYSPILTEDDTTMGSVEIIDDRTELTQLSERLHAMDKMAALGTMAAGIAHEIRNPMNAVMGFAGLLKRELPEDERSQRWASLIVDGCKEANAIISGVLTLADPERIQWEQVDGEQLLASAVEAAYPNDVGDVADDVPGTATGAESALGTRAKWSVTTRCSVPRFRGDRIKLRQALRNLVANAFSVMPDGGDVNVSLALEDSQIVARIADAGPGLTEDLRQRVFDPFFTTRAEGSGLGLSLVAAIAQVHGGTAAVSPDPGPLGGAEFTFRIPYSPIS